MKISELKKRLRNKGCRFDHQGTNHEIWYSPITGNYFPVGRHDTEEVRAVMLSQIKRQAGI